MNAAYIPNIITALRIVGTFGLIFTKTFSPVFYIVYFFTGITDFFDGFLARRLKVTSEFGAKLDSIADMFFDITMIIKILPALLLVLPVFIWYLVGAIVLMRVASYIVSAIKFHKMASLHTIMNKITGFLVFLVPFFIHTQIGVGLCTLICVLAIIAAVEDLCINIGKKEYATDVKTIISK